MSEMLKRKFPRELNFERQRTKSIGPGQLPHFHNELFDFWLREDQFATNREEVIPLRKLIRRVIAGGKGTGLPDPRNLKMQLLFLTASGIHHP
jgi:hypothetical protein